MDLFAFFKITYGLYVVSSKLDDVINGLIVSTVCQVTAEPVRLVTTVNKINFSHELIQKSGYFGVSVLDIHADLKFIANFGFKSGRDVQKFKNIDYTIGKTGVPLLTDHSIASFECKVIDSFDVGTHTIFLGEALESTILSSKAPMTYDYYYNVVKGKSPSTAPTYHKPQ